MRTLIFATNNENKIAEVDALVGDMYDVRSLKEVGLDIDIPEPHNTLEANASEKSQTIYKLTGKDCFSEDTGLEVYTLNGAPGVLSARYAGEGKSNSDNIKKLLSELEGKGNRIARFRTVVSLILGGSEHLFEGICEGSIVSFPKGDTGFGYDPIFVPNGDERTFAEMTLAEKNQYSHRKKAIAQLLAFLSLNGNK